MKNESHFETTVPMPVGEKILAALAALESRPNRIPEYSEDEVIWKSPVLYFKGPCPQYKQYVGEVEFRNGSSQYETLPFHSKYPQIIFYVRDAALGTISAHIASPTLVPTVVTIEAENTIERFTFLPALGEQHT